VESHAPARRDRLRVLFMTQGRRDSAARFRVYQYLPHLRAAGFEPVVVPCVPERSFTALRGSPWLRPLRLARHAAMLPSRLRGIVLARHCDIVFLQRDLWWGVSPLPERAIARVNPNVVFDFDDAIWLYSPRRRREPVATIAALAKIVVAGNSYLADYARQHNPRVVTIPTPVDTERFKPAAGAREGGPLRLVWTGSAPTLPNLYGCAEALAAFARARPARLLVIADRRPDQPLGLPVDFVPWSEESELTALQRADIGIMPLPDDPWTRGKCAFKLLQYMAVGIPAVASPVGMNREVIAAPGDGGLLASTPAEWVNALTRLADDAALRAQVGERGRARAVTSYSLASWAPRLAETLRELAPDGTAYRRSRSGEP
jgi:glycosyltransferase involved in cell wall biosynthesis